MFGRIVTVLAGVVGVAAGVAAALKWLGDHAPVWVFLMAAFGTALLGLTVGVGLYVKSRSFPPSARGQWTEILVILVIIFIISALISKPVEYFTRDEPTRNTVRSIVAAVFGVGCLVWGVNGYDKRTSKKCPDCAERIKAEARVCHFCGMRFEPRPTFGDQRRRSD